MARLAALCVLVALGIGCEEPAPPPHPRPIASAAPAPQPLPEVDWARATELVRSGRIVVAIETPGDRVYLVSGLGDEVSARAPQPGNLGKMLAEVDPGARRTLRRRHAEISWPDLLAAWRNDEIHWITQTDGRRAYVKLAGDNDEHLFIKPSAVDVTGLFRVAEPSLQPPKAPSYVEISWGKAEELLAQKRVIHAALLHFGRVVLTVPDHDYLTLAPPDVDAEALVKRAGIAPTIE